MWARSQCCVLCRGPGSSCTSLFPETSCLSPPFLSGNSHPASLGPLTLSSDIHPGPLQVSNAPLFFAQVPPPPLALSFLHSSQPDLSSLTSSWTLWSPTVSLALGLCLSSSQRCVRTRVQAWLPQQGPSLALLTPSKAFILTAVSCLLPSRAPVSLPALWPQG